MSENEKKNLLENQESDSSPKLSDEALEGATGGISIIDGHITIADTCRRVWDKRVCLDALWGACPNLDVTSETVASFKYKDTYRCKKGFFNFSLVNRH